ncbi:MAG: DNA repair protein RadA [Bacteroidales bacterium]|nr:DNA repair protein RadA [Bacteroidales bacterium]
MAKIKTTFICQNCGANSPKWIGKCPSCGEWNSYVEEIQTKVTADKYSTKGETNSKPQSLSSIQQQQEERIVTKNNEFNRVIGGGIVLGSLSLIGGDPGIGKSTLLLQIALSLNKNILYISGEESLNQIKLRAERIQQQNDKALFLSETNIERILHHVDNSETELVIIDSIQTVYTERVESSPGSVTQVRESTMMLLKYAKEHNIPMILIGHINKDGNIAGPKVLEHIVDTVLQFEGDKSYMYRILRSLKNRFGSTHELGIFEMQGSGLKEIENPSELLISQQKDSYSGTAIAATIDGTRPFMIEIQALVSTAAYGTPQRSATGYDTRRLNMLLAVLEKRIGFRLNMKDVFLNIAGGIRVEDPAIDLSIVCAILSSDQDLEIDAKTCFAGEVGLTGEIRAVNRIDQRIKEAEKLGFERIFISEYNKEDKSLHSRIKIVRVKKVTEVFRNLFA